MDWTRSLRALIQLESQTKIITLAINLMEVLDLMTKLAVYRIKENEDRSCMIV